MSVFFIVLIVLIPMALLLIMYLNEQGYFPFIIDHPAWLPIVLIVAGIALGAYWGGAGGDDDYRECGSGRLKYDC